MHSINMLLDTIVPKTSAHSHKGQAGKICVLGGCKEYTGAPYFAAMTALKLGCDLSTIMCSFDAAIAIKSYSPDIIVHGSLLPTSTNDNNHDDVIQCLAPILDWLPKYHSVIIGPGLGRDMGILNSVVHVIESVKQRHLPLVLDGDALWLVSQRPEIVQGYHQTILTPNCMEFCRLWQRTMTHRTAPLSPVTLHQFNRGSSIAEVSIDFNENTSDTAALAVALGGVTIVRKGVVDIISDGSIVIVCEADSSPRRVGGQGDILAGAVGAFVSWAVRSDASDTIKLAEACALACATTRKASSLAFTLHGRAMLASDLLAEMGRALDALIIASPRE